MSYLLGNSGFGLGETESWLGLWGSKDEVYVFRGRVSGAKLQSPTDAMLFVRAIGQGQVMQLDVRGVALSPPDASGDFMIDVVMTSPTNGPNFVVTNAVGMAKAIEADAAIRAAFPSIKITQPDLLELVNPPEAVDHWRSQPVLWDHSLPGPAARGGPTDSFANPGEYSVVFGTSDAGKQAKPWVVTKPGLGPSVTGGGDESDTVLKIIGAIALGVAAYFVAKGKRR